MKKLFSVVILAVFCLTAAMAQNVTGSFKTLKDAGRVKMVVDFSKASIIGMTEEEFSKYEVDWEKDKPEILSLFYTYANRRLGNSLSLGGSFDESRYMLTLIVRTVSAKGDYDCDLVLTENGKEVARAEMLRAYGGTFGTKLNLMKDGAKHTGRELGWFLFNQFYGRN